MQSLTNDLWRSGHAPIAQPDGWHDWQPAANGEFDADVVGPQQDASTDAASLRVDITPVEQILRMTQAVALGRHRCPQESVS